MSPTRYNSASSDPSPLARPLQFTFSGRTATNRILKAATTERLASWNPQDIENSGIPTKSLINVYRRWGLGGYGVIVTGNVMIGIDHLEAPGNMIIPDGALQSLNDDRFRAYQEMGKAAKSSGSLVIGQLNHPGRQTKLEFQANPVSASAIPLKDVLGMRFGKPHAATQEEIDLIVHRFGNSAEYLWKAGWDGVQIHAAHGYLLAQFLSNTTNKRDDKYGGSLENRVRIVLEVVEEIRRRVPAEFSISIKVNSVEFQDDGLSVEEARELCELLERRAKVDFIELSGGTYEELAWEHKRESTKAREAFFLDFAEIVIPALSDTKTYVTGGFKSLDGMVGALKTVDGVGIARPACQEFDFGRKLLEGHITAAIKQGLDDQNFMLTNVAAGTQIGQVGLDHEPIDLSDSTNVAAFMADLGKWMESLQKDEKMEMTGFVNVTSVPSQPYGTSL